jgi:hypothetical protein
MGSRTSLFKTNIKVSSSLLHPWTHIPEEPCPYRGKRCYIRAKNNLDALLDLSLSTTI